MMTSKTPSRSCEDVDEQALSFAEVKALATGNPLIKEKMDLDVKVMKLKLLKANFISQQYKMEDNIVKVYPQMMSKFTELKNALLADQKLVCKDPNSFAMTICETHYTDKKEAGKAIIDAISTFKANKHKAIGEYCGFNLFLVNKGFDGMELTLKGQASHHVSLGSDALGNLTRINNVLDNIPNRIKVCDQEISSTLERLKNAQVEVGKPFSQEQELSDSLIRLKELNLLLSTDRQIEAEPEEAEDLNESWDEQAV